MKRDPGAGRRILWLLNHSTLRDCEVPLLRDMGFEVFAPKRFPRNSDNRSASVSFEYDDSLTLPADALEELNAHDFYMAGMSPRISHLMNHYFETAIFAYMFPMLDVMVTRFHGRLLLRAFGLTHPTHTYYGFAEKVVGPNFRRRLSKASDRFWFAAGYPNLKEIEPPLFQERNAFLPVGLPPRVLRRAGSWTGGDDRILFVCPEIKTYPELREVYDEFKRHFGDMPHVICGPQTIPVERDPNVVGRVDAEEYDRLFRECAVMFYHSRLPRHLHYHPVEAACYGMPLVYMADGMLGILGGKTLPGASTTLEEARRKVVRLRDPAETAFRTSVVTAQRKIVDHFLPPQIEAAWRENFLGKVIATSLLPRKPLKVAVLTFDPTPAALCLAVQAAESLADLRAAESDRFNVVLGILRVEGQGHLPENPETFTVRPFEWINIEAPRIEIAQRLLGSDTTLGLASYSVPEDDISQFMDCDVWLMVGGASVVAVAPLKPLAYLPLPNDCGKGTTDANLPIDGPGRSHYEVNLGNMRAILNLDNMDRAAFRREFNIRPSMFITVATAAGEGGSLALDGKIILEALEAIA